MSICRSSFAALLAALLLAGSGAVLAQEAGDVPGMVEEVVQEVCASLEKYREGDSKDLLEKPGLQWRVHVAPLECSPDSFSFYVKIDPNAEIRFLSRPVGADPVEVQSKDFHDKFGPYWAHGEAACDNARGVLVETLGVPPQAQSMASDLALAVAKRVEELGLASALVPGDVLTLPALPPQEVQVASTDAPDLALPRADAPNLGPSPSFSTPDLSATAQAAQAGATADAGWPTVDDLAVDSEGVAKPAQEPGQLEDIFAYHVETQTSAGPGDAEATLDPEPLVGLLALEDPEARSPAEEPISSDPPPEEVLEADPVPEPSDPRLPVEPAAHLPKASPGAGGTRSGPPPMTLRALGKAIGSPAGDEDVVAAMVVGSVAGMVALALVALYHRLSDREMRSGKTRARILDLLAREPGLLATDVGDRLRLHRTTAEYHLRLLRKTGVVTARTSTRRATYFLSDSPFLLAPSSPSALEAPAARVILELARASPGATIGEAAAAAGVDISAASRHARRLRDASLLDVRADGRFRRLFAPS